MEDYTEVKVSFDSQYTDTAADLAVICFPEGVYFDDYRNIEADVVSAAHIDLIDEDLLNKSGSDTVMHVFLSPDKNVTEEFLYFDSRMKDLGIEYSTCESHVKESDWRNNWKKYFRPLECGKKLLICPSWEKLPDDNNRIKLLIDPGLAFGTGSHETTRLCLEALEDSVTSGKTVLDIGCGSGILAIASVLLGAEHADGADIDGYAVKNAVENAQLNCVSDKTDFVCGDLTEKISGKHDIITANIVADIIIRLFGNVKDYMNDNAVFIVSGIIDTRENDVLTAAKQNSFTVAERRCDGGWICLTLKK